MGRLLQIGLLASLLASALGETAVAAAANPSPATVARIDRDVLSMLRRLGAPGAAVMVVQGGRVSFVKSYGSRDLARSLPVRTDTRFEIGSITKQFTAASVMRLQEAGKLQIDRPLSDYLPHAPHAKEVTLRQLLSHTSGLHDYLDLPDAELFRLAAQPSSYDALIGRVATLPLDFPPGSKWSYSNTGYLLLGKVIETVSGVSYKDYLDANILRPLGMTATVTTAEEADLPGAALGYHHIAGKLERAPVIDPTWAGSAGFLVAPLSDLAKWDRALQGGQIVSLESYRQMTTSAVSSKGEPFGYGLGLFVDKVLDEPRVGHTGGSLGFTTADEYFPRLDLRILAFTNLGQGTPEAGEAITNAIFENLYPAITAKALKPSPGEDATITAAVREAFVQLQKGKGYGRFAPKLHDKLISGAGARFVESIGPFGPASEAIFKGARRDGNDRWYDYTLRFGPGVTLPFAARIDGAGKVAGISIG